MENNESNPKPPETGGLNILTIFIAVLALHVLVIGGITVYQLMKGGSTDADLVTDKTHKAVKVASEGDTAGDGQLPDGTVPDKSAMASTSATTPPAPSGATNNTEITIPAPTSGPVDTVTESDSAPSPASASVITTPSSPATASTPSGPMPTGPGMTPPISSSPSPSVAAQPVTTPSTADSEAGPAVGGTPYVVKAHDSLARIAHQHRVTVAKLKAANSLKSNLLRIGQKLTIPEKSETGSTSLASLREPNAPLLGDTDATAPRAKPVDSLPRDQGAVTRSSSGHHTYTVARGDTLIKIARKFRTTPSAIIAANNSIDARKLRIGQKLKIPAQESRSANTSPAPTPAPEQPIEPRATPSAQLANFIP